MGPTIKAVKTSDKIPEQTEGVIIGGGIVGLSAALTLAERGIPVVVAEKGKIAAEQSSRNLGWVRKTNRLAEDIPLSLAADRLWQQMPARTGFDVGYRQAGIMFLARNEKQMAAYEKWYQSARHLDLGSKLLSNEEIASMVPGGREKWYGGVFTASDGRAEPTEASSAIAAAAVKKGAIIKENCAVRTLSLSAGKISGVITEEGEIRCSQVLLAGGLWSRRFLGNLGIQLPTLPLVCSVLRTAPLPYDVETAVGAPDFSFRKHRNGGFIITQRGALDAPLTLDHLRIGLRYLEPLKAEKDNLCISFGKYFWEDLQRKRRWKSNQITPFEHMRIMDPAPNEKLNGDAMRNLCAAWEIFTQAQIEQSWAGMIDITPDSNPVIDRIAQIPGLTVATGFSGHGFGTGPAAGQLAADLTVEVSEPLVNPHPYRFSRL